MTSTNTTTRRPPAKVVAVLAAIMAVACGLGVIAGHAGVAMCEAHLPALCPTSAP